VGDGTAPLIGIISRLADQKGFDLIAEIAETLLAMKLQLVVLGTGDAKYHELFKALAQKYSDKLAVFLKFDNALAHRIEAGSDMFLMPSLYEPCGLNQLYSLKYGTIPIVRTTADWPTRLGRMRTAMAPVFGLTRTPVRRCLTRWSARLPSMPTDAPGPPSPGAPWLRISPGQIQRHSMSSCIV
jgi:glycosyltransferase involved in cell wall biosynthesis